MTNTWTASTGGRRAAAGMAAAAMTLGVFGAGCGVVTAVKNAVGAVQRDKSVIDGFTGKLQSGPSTFEATYVTTGSAPATVIYAAQSPDDLAFSDRSTGRGTGSGSLDVIANSSGEYACSPPSAGSSSRWTCDKLGKASATAQNQLFDLYTPSHWVAFLRTFSLAAGLAGDKIRTSSITRDGFAMNCVDFQASGVPGTSKICTTTQGILGYVKVASVAASFELKSYSASPPASLFQLPAGAKVTTIKSGSSSGT